MPTGGTNANRPESDSAPDAKAQAVTDRSRSLQRMVRRCGGVGNKLSSGAKLKIQLVDENDNVIADSWIRAELPFGGDYMGLSRVLDRLAKDAGIPYEVEIWNISAIEQGIRRSACLPSLRESGGLSKMRRDLGVCPV